MTHPAAQVGMMAGFQETRPEVTMDLDGGSDDLALIRLVGCSTSPTAPPRKTAHHSRTYLVFSSLSRDSATPLRFRAGSVYSVFPW
jgi:hypothetical protein